MNRYVTPATALATKRQIKTSTIVQIALAVGAIAVGIFSARPGVNASLISALIVGEILTAYLLMGQAVRKRCPALLMLAGAFLSAIVGYNATPAVLTMLGFPAPASFMAGAFAARMLFAGWFVAYALVENYCFSRTFAGREFVVRASGLLAVSIVAPYALARAIVPLAASGVVFDRGVWLAGTLVLAALAFVIFSWRSVASVTNVALRVSLQCALIDLGLVAISAPHSLGHFGAQCFGLIACVIVPAVFLAEFNGMYAQLASESDTCRDQALRDALTGVGNRRAYEGYIHSRMSAFHKGEIPNLGLLVVDVDNFKAYNDTFGHEAGDRCLKRIAKAIELTTARADDSVFRYGGEEFAVVLAFADIEGLRLVAERIRNAVSNLAIPHMFTPFRRVTVSIGVSIASNSTDAIELFNQADCALYLAKSSGRNCTKMQPPAGEPVPFTPSAASTN